MHSILAMCALRIALAQPLPATLEQFYRSQFGCLPPTWTTEMAQTDASLSEINVFFPAPKRVWPLLSFSQSNLVVAAEYWLARGVSPGILLPYDYTPVARNRALLKRLHRVSQDGAVMVLKTERPLPAHLESRLAIYIALGLPPYTLYISDGYDVDLQAQLQPGSYLVAGYWYRHPEWPLPSRELAQGGRRYIPVYLNNPPSNGTLASETISVGDVAFTPEIGFKQQIGAAVFELAPDGMRTSLIGLIELGLLQMGMPLIIHGMPTLLAPAKVLSRLGSLMALSLIAFVAVWLTLLFAQTARWMVRHVHG